jgi:hypothetical protein
MGEPNFLLGRNEAVTEKREELTEETTGELEQVSACVNAEMRHVHAARRVCLESKQREGSAGDGKHQQRGSACRAQSSGINVKSRQDK